jgi:endo-1,3(4)-beta-glucanase
VQYYYAAFIENIRVGAVEFSGQVKLEVLKSEPFNTLVRLTRSPDSYIEAPIVRGSAYFTTLFVGASPVISTIHAILTVNGANPGKHTGSKFKLTLNNGQTWLVYVIDGTTGAAVSITLEYQAGKLVSAQRLSGVAIRVCQIPRFKFDGTTAVSADVITQSESVYDKHSGTYEVGAELFAEVDQEAKKGRYGWTWKKAGAAGSLLKFALPHQIDQFTGGVEKTVIQLVSPTAGMMTGVIGDRWELGEPDVATIGQVGITAVRDIPANRKADIAAQLATDVNGLSAVHVDASSYYYAGKKLHRAAELALVADALGDAATRSKVVQWTAAAFEPFIQGTLGNKLLYDTTWHGIVSKTGLSDSGADFGNGYYNDHHFHWGYFFVAAAIIAKYDTAFRDKVKPWIQTLIRDVMNPSAQDTRFPVFRSFDWFCGHCFAQGIFASADGKDEESTSEEIAMHYGISIWGLASENADIRRLGQLSLAVSARSIRRYFLMTADNDIHPAQFIGNKVTGIKFENKCDYTTWFGANTEYKHGIQMIPPLPCTEYVRTRVFCTQEWQLISGVATSCLSKGQWWGTVLLWSQALIDRNAAYDRIKTAPVDEHQSRTWNLYFAATAPP